MLISKDYARDAAQDDQPGQGVEVVDQLVRVHLRIAGDDAPLDRRRQAQRRGDDLHARSPATARRIVVPGAGFLLNNEMGDFNAAPGLTDERGMIGTIAEPRAARQAHAVEHGADDHRQGRPAVHGHRHAGRPHHHQHRADDDPQRDRLRDERAGSGGCGPHASPVAARSPQPRALRILRRHDRDAARRWATPSPKAAARARPR